jgi:hypothetical protein
MFHRKVYGESKQNICVICRKAAFTENEQGLPVCNDHKGQHLEDKKCACGSYMDIKKSKWGAFFLCPNCGPISLSKVMAIGEETGCGYKLNKKYRKPEYNKERVYTLDELDKMWADKN